MTRAKDPKLTVETFSDHQVITQPNPLRKMIRRVAENDGDDPVARAEKALQELSSEFDGWMMHECDRLAAAHTAMEMKGIDAETRDELMRAAHDIKGSAATFGYPTAAAAAESLCRIIEHAPDFEKVPPELIAHHVNAIQAIVRENDRIDALGVSAQLSKKLRGVADEYLTHVNRDRPEHLEAILAPSIIPVD
jgi:chemotaxis protein histidine kinase CheA